MASHFAPDPSAASANDHGLGGTIRRLFRRAGDEPGDDRYAAMDQIRAFLSAHGLDPSPAHYDFAHRLLIERDSMLVHAVERAMARDGRLTGETVALLVTQDAEGVPPALIEGLLDEARENLSRLGEIVGQTRGDAQAYGEALEQRAGLLADAGASHQLLAQFVEVTRTLIAKTREADTRMAAMAEQIDQLRENLEEASRAADTDPLTGLANRRAIERRLLRAIADAHEDRSPLTLAYCDIDHFKSINDTHGHEIGDRILKFVAELMARESDDDTLVGRHGGEEFVMLFEHIPFDQARAKVNELRRDLGGRRLAIRETGEKIGDVTFSAGMAALEEGQDMAAFLRAADEALYLAKEQGRDRVVSARGAGSRPRRP